jgi:hypothetical protein
VGGHAKTAGWLLGGHAGGAKFPKAGLAGGGRRGPTGQLASEISEAEPSHLRAAFIVSRLALMASLTSLTSSWASVAMAADWFTTRSMLMPITSFRSPQSPGEAAQLLLVGLPHSSGHVSGEQCFLPDGLSEGPQGVVRS